MSSFSFCSTAPEMTEQSGESLGARVKLRPEWGKIILLSGDLGSGKTTFARGFFQGLGCQETPTSPTFSFFREYTTGALRAVHADLYRFQDAQTNQPIEFISAALQEFAERGDVLFIEWADQSQLDFAALFAANFIEVAIARPRDIETERQCTVQFHTKESISEEETMALMAEFMTPVHVRQHIFTVTKVATRLAAALFAQGVCLDQDLVKNGALCHDLVRYVDFRDFADHSRYKEEVTSQKLQLWQSVQKKYGALRHAGAISAILRERGFAATAKITEAHYTSQVFRSEPFSLEEKVVYYADKRVLHDQIVSLAERFADGRKRYAHEANPELEAKVFALEAELFAPLKITPTDIGV